MKVRYFILAMAACAVIGCEKEPQKIGENANGSAQKIGVYDSRAVAVAYCNSDLHKQEIKKMEDALAEAKKKNDAALIQQCEAAFREGQARMHRQGFSVAPVDDILAQIQEPVRSIQKETNVTAVISKWDEKKLAEFPNSEKVDVTESLIQALHPTEKQRKVARDIQTQKPIPLEQIDEMIKSEKKM